MVHAVARRPPGTTGARAASSADLVRAAQEGEPWATDQLLRRSRTMARGMALRAGCRPSELDDVLQEAAMQTLLWLPTLRDPAAFGAWFARLVLMVTRSHQRREQRRQRLVPVGPADVEETLWDAPMVCSPEAIAEARELSRLLDQLPAKVREAVRLRHLEGLQLEEVAARTGASLATVKRHLAAAEARVRRALDRDLRKMGEPPSPRRRRRRIEATAILLALGAWRGRAAAFARAAWPVAAALLLVVVAATVSPRPREMQVASPVAGRPLPLVQPSAVADRAAAAPQALDDVELWTVTPFAADALVESMGLNVRLGEDTQPLSLVRDRLAELGIRHVIDVQGSRLDWLASLEPAGIRTNLFIETDQDAHAAVAGRGFVEAVTLKQWRPGLPLEAWARVQRRWMADTHRRLRADPSTRHVAIVGATMSDDDKREALGDVSAFVDFAGSGTPSKRLPPGGVFLDGTLAVYRPVYGARPVVVPQALFATGGCDDCVSERTQARYVVRTFFENHRRGIVRTYGTHLFDRVADPTQFEQGMGLARHDGGRKPSFEALARVIRLFSERGAPAPSAAVHVELSGTPVHLERALYQRRDGSLLLALWLAVASGGDDPAATVRVRPPEGLRVRALHGAGTAEPLPVAEADGQGFVAVPVSDDVVVVELR